MNSVLFSKKSDQWATPKELYNFIISKGFVDPCPLTLDYIDFRNIKGDKLFINPPYSKIKEFVDFYSTSNIPIIWLLPSRTGTEWFKTLMSLPFASFWFIRGRLKFNDYGSAPFDSLIVFQNFDFNFMEVVDRCNLIEKLGGVLDDLY